MYTAPAGKKLTSLYLLGLPLGRPAALLLNIILESEISGRPFQGSQRKLSAIGRMSLRTVKRAVKELRELGYVYVEFRGNNQTNVYYVAGPLRRAFRMGPRG
jgi:DNA-binding transcriptional ArsR family regulator